MCVSVGGVGRDSVGGMELRVGSNMILFLYILLLLIWHMYFLVCVYYTLVVVIIICIMFEKLRKCWRML